MIGVWHERSFITWGDDDVLLERFADGHGVVWVVVVGDSQPGRFSQVGGV